MKQAILELIDRKEKEMKDTAGFATGDIRYRTVIDCLNWMKEEVEKMEDENAVFDFNDKSPDDNRTIVCSTVSQQYALADVDDGTLVFDDEYAGLTDFTHWQYVLPPHPSSHV